MGRKVVLNLYRPLSNKFVGLCIALLFVLYYIGPVTIRWITGTPFGWLGSGLVSRFIGWWFWSFLLCLYVRLLDRISTSHRRGVGLTVLPIAFVFLIGGTSLYFSLPSVRVQRILAGAQFAPLPKSPSEIKVLAWYTPLSGEEYLRFRASSDDIESFLIQSPILKNAEFEEYSDKKMRLFFTLGSTYGSSPSNNHEYINKKPNAPPWYMQEIKNIARRYKIQPKDYNSAGELIFDEKNNLIFIKLLIG